MKLLHTSDWHFGMPLATDTLEEDHRDFLRQLEAILVDEQVDAVLCAGDVYDSSVTNARAIALYNDAVTMICGKLALPMIVIAGNHDSGARLASCRELLKTAGLFVTGKLTRTIEPVVLDGGTVEVYAVPFFNRDEVTALFPEKAEAIRSYETAFAVVCDHIRAHWNPEAKHILVAHALVVKAELSDSDRAARVGFATAVSKDVFDGFDYVALGHIHKPQIITDTVRYSGSPLCYSFGAEETHDKGVVIIDIDSGQQKTVPITPFHPRRSLVGTYDEVMASEGNDNAYLHIEITDRYAGLQLYSDLKARFPFMLELKGKTIEETGASSTLTDEELETLDEAAVMKKFMEELFGYCPDERQQALFSAATEQSEKGGDRA